MSFAAVLQKPQCIWTPPRIATFDPSALSGPKRANGKGMRCGACLRAGAARLSMPEVPAHTFALACMAVVAGSREYVPPMGKGSLYLRPLLLGTGPILGLGPAPSYTFLVFGAAVGAYFKVGLRHPSSCMPAHSSPRTMHAVHVLGCTMLRVSSGQMLQVFQTAPTSCIA